MSLDYIIVVIDCSKSQRTLVKSVYLRLQSYSDELETDTSGLESGQGRGHPMRAWLARPGGQCTEDV